MQHMLGFSGTIEICLRKAKLPEYFSRLRELNLGLSLKDFHATPADIILVQAIRAGEELESSMKLLFSRLREWYGWFAPLEVPLTIETLCSKVKSATPSSQFTASDVAEMKALAQRLLNISNEVATHQEYVYSRLGELMPATVAIATPRLAAKFLCHTGSLRRLALMSSSTIQLLGAEKALFRHLATGAKSPKYGFLIEHPLVQQSQNKGREARRIAGKIAIAARTDFFRTAHAAERAV